MGLDKFWFLETQFYEKNNWKVPIFQEDKNY